MGRWIRRRWICVWAPRLLPQVTLSRSFARGRCRRGRSEIPHFCSKLLLFALVLYKGEAEKCEEKGEKCEEKGEKCVKKGENHSDPIYTNPIKNLPTLKPFKILGPLDL